MPTPYEMTDKDIYENGIVAHGVVMAAGMVVMFRGWTESEPVVFATGAAVTVAGAFGLSKNRKIYEERTNRPRNRNIG